MANLQINDKLAERLQYLADREQRPIETLLEELIDQRLDRFDDPLLEAVPPDVEDKAAYLAALREIRPKIYAMARDYWQRTGDHERLALTDRDLDRQFWLIDHEGIPRLKSEEGSIQLPPDPVEAILGIIDTNLTDLSTTVRETMAAHYRDKDGRTD